MARLRTSAVLAVFAVLLRATATADQAAAIPKVEPAQTAELMKRVEHMKLAFGVQPPPLLGLERQARQVQVSRPQTPPPRDPSPEDAKSLPSVSQSSVDSLEQVSEEELEQATGTAGPRDAGFDRGHIEAMEAETKRKEQLAFTPPGCPAPQARWLHASAMLAGSMYVFGGVTSDAVSDATALSNRMWSLQPEASYWSLVDAPRKSCVHSYPRHMVQRRPATAPAPPPPPPTAGFRPDAALRDAIQGTRGAYLPGEGASVDAALGLRGRLAARLMGKEAVDSPGEPMLPVTLPITDRGLLRGAPKPIKIAKLPKPTTKPAYGYKDRMTPDSESKGKLGGMMGFTQLQAASGQTRSAAHAAESLAHGWQSEGFTAMPRKAQLSLLAAVATSTHSHAASESMRLAHEAWADGDLSAARSHHLSAISHMEATAPDASLLQTGTEGSAPKPLPGRGLDGSPIEVESGGFTPMAPSQVRLLPHAPDALWKHDLAAQRWSRPVTQHEFVARLRKAVQLTAGSAAMAVEAPGSLPPIALLQTSSSSSLTAMATASPAPELPPDLQAQDVLENSELGGASGVPAVGAKVRAEGIGLARPVPRLLASLVPLQGGLLLFGGVSPSWQLMADAWFYDPAAFEGLGQWWCVWGCPAEPAFAYRSERTGKPVVSVPLPAHLSAWAGKTFSLAQTSASHGARMRVSAEHLAEVAAKHHAAMATESVSAAASAERSDRASLSRGQTGGASLGPAEHDPMTEVSAPASTTTMRIPRFEQAAGAAIPPSDGAYSDDDDDEEEEDSQGDEDEDTDMSADDDDDDQEGDSSADDDDEEEEGDGDVADDDDDVSSDEEELPLGPFGPGDNAGDTSKVNHRQESAQGDQLLSETSRGLLPDEAKGVPMLPFDTAIDSLSASVTHKQRVSDSLFPPREGHTAVVIGARVPKKAVALPPTGMFGGLPTTKSGGVDSKLKISKFGLPGAPKSIASCGGKPSASKGDKAFTCSSTPPASAAFGSLKSGSPVDMGRIGSSRKEVMLVYGGLAAGHDAGMQHVWAFALQPEPMWLMVSSEGSQPPPLRWLHSASTVAVRERDVVKDSVKSQAEELMVIFGGCSRDGRAMDDAWAFNLAMAHWHTLRATGLKPTARWLHAAVALAEPRLPRAANKEDGLGDGAAADIFSRLSLAAHPELLGTSQEEDSERSLRRDALEHLTAAKLIKPPSLGFGFLQQQADDQTLPSQDTPDQQLSELELEDDQEEEDDVSGQLGSMPRSMARFVEVVARDQSTLGAPKPVPGPLYARPEVSDLNYVIMSGGASHGVIFDDVFSLRIMETPKTLRKKAADMQKASKSASGGMGSGGALNNPLPGYNHPMLGSLDAQWDLVAPANPGPAGVEGATMVGISTGQGLSGPPLLGEERQWALQWGGARDSASDTGRLGDGEGVSADLFLDVVARSMLYDEGELEALREGDEEARSRWEAKAKTEGHTDSTEQTDEASVDELQPQTGSVASLLQRSSVAGLRGIDQGLSSGRAQDTALAHRQIDEAGRERAEQPGAAPSGLGAETGETMGDGSSLTHALLGKHATASGANVDTAQLLSSLVRRDAEATDPTVTPSDDAPSPFLVGGPPRPPRQLPPAAQVAMYMGILEESRLASPVDDRWQRLSGVMPTTHRMAVNAIAEYAAMVEKPALLKELKAEAKADAKAGGVEGLSPDKASDKIAGGWVNFFKAILKLR